ncbi:MAG: POTRA domain-containing protein [Verrucomicrobiota bacterium]
MKPPPPNYEGRRIASLSIRYVGRPTVDEARLKNSISSKAGTRYSNERLDADIMSLYESGLVDDVRFTAEPDGKAIRLIAEIQTRPPLCCGLFVSGNTVFSDQRLALVSKLKTDEPTGAQIEAARRNIEEYYRRNGYKEVKVTLTFPWGHTGSKNREWVFDIHEGPLTVTPKLGNQPVWTKQPG